MCVHVVAVPLGEHVVLSKMADCLPGKPLLASECVAVLCCRVTSAPFPVSVTLLPSKCAHRPGR